MDTVPYIISTKDLSYLCDMYNWNYNAFKQVNHYINEVHDEEVKDLLERILNMHYEHLYYIVSILKKETNDINIEEDNDNEE